MRPMSVPQPARRDRGGPSTRCAARATRPSPPPPAGAGGGCSPCGPCACRHRRDSIVAGRACAVPPAPRDRPPQPALAEGRAPCGPCVCRSRRVAIAAGRARAVPPARRDRPPQPELEVGSRARRHMCVLPQMRRDRGGTSTRCAARATRPPSPAASAGGGRAVRLLSAPIDTLCLILTPHPPGGQLSRDDHGLAWLARTLEHVLCMQPASPVTLPTVPRPARTAPPVFESLPFLHRAPSPDARRVLARRTGRPHRPAAVGWAAGSVPSDSGKNCIVLPVMKRGPTGRVTRKERVFFRSERTGPPDGGRPLRPPGCTGPTHSRAPARPYVCRRNGIAKTQTQNCVACGAFPFKATPHIWLQPFPLWRIPGSVSRTSYRACGSLAGPRRYAPSIPLVAHGFTTTQPPLARRLARFAQRFATFC
jgi:hypothetical protein